MKRSATSSLVFALSASLSSLVACGGGVAQERTSDGGTDGGEGADGTTILPTDGGTADGTTTGPVDSGVLGYDVSVGPNGEGGHPGDDASGNSGDDAGGGGTPVDAGYYYGDGSFWVEGGAYPNLPDSGTQPDASSPGLDASPGCATLAACCPSLQGTSQGLCDDIVAAGNASDCAAELSQLQGAGSCSGTTVLASEVQLPANRMVSDGSLLFWTTTSTPGLLAMPVGGGPVTVLLDGPITNTFGIINGISGFFLAVDDVNVYVLESNNLVRIPKNGGAATLVNEPGALVTNATTLGGTAYWVESVSPYGMALIAKSAPMLGGAVSLIASFNYPGNYPVPIGVTSNTFFLGGPSQSQVYSFPTSTGVPASGLTMASQSCYLLASDTNAVYCSQTAGSNVSIASDGMASTLGPAINSSTIVFDDTFAYWADMTTVGTIMKAPKAGGGSATVLATDTSPTAIAVDANSVYWADQEGYIKSVPK